MPRRPGLAITLLLLIPSAACDRGETVKPGEAPNTFEYHRQFAIGSSLEPVLDACDGPKCALQNNPVFDEIEFVTDSSAKLQGVLLRTRAPDPPNVSKEQALFERTRGVVQGELGQGESFLKSGNPWYWPARTPEERVVSLTIDEGRTVLAVGAVGIDADKIPAAGAARDPAQVQTYWSKISEMESLATQTAE